MGRKLGWLGAVVMVGCGGGGAPAPGSLVVDPPTVSLLAGETQRFTAEVAGASDPSVAWSVAEGEGGGSISADGLYTSPRSPGTFHVVASSHGRSATASVEVRPTVPAAVSIVIEPASATVSAGSTLALTARVSGTTDQRVAWNSDGGTVDPAGTWQAPATGGTYHVVARSLADPTKTATALLSVTEASNVAVAIAPTALPLEVGRTPTWDFVATVTGTPDTGVLWSVEEGAAGGSVDASGRYTVPAVEGTFHVVATSHADPSKKAVATVTVGPNQQDLVDHGGPVEATSRTFLVWWGDAARFPADARPALERFLGGLDGSSFLGLADEYMRGVSATTSFGGSLFDASTPSDNAGGEFFDVACRATATSGTSPRDGDIYVVVTPNFPADAQGVYCGGHISGNCNGRTLLAMFVPNPAGSWCDRTANACADGLSLATEGLAETLSHELVESLTDPLGTGWKNPGGGEAADLCGNPACVSLPAGVFSVNPVYSNAHHACVSP